MLNICLLFINFYLLAFMRAKQGLIEPNPGKCNYSFTILSWPCALRVLMVSAIESWQTIEYFSECGQPSNNLHQKPLGCLLKCGFSGPTTNMLDQNLGLRYAAPSWDLLCPTSGLPLGFTFPQETEHKPQTVFVLGPIPFADLIQE